MNTPAHVIFAAAAFARPHARRRTLAALAGALVPDLSLYLMAGWAIWIAGQSPHDVFDTLYFSDAWQRVFRVDNSFLVWGAAFGLAWWAGARAAMVFAASALLHLAFDLPLHNADARPHFWPLSDWVFRSPVSYWDNAHHAGLVGPLETGLSMVFCAVLMRRFPSLCSRLLIAALATVQVSPFFIWAFVFAPGAG